MHKNNCGSFSSTHRRAPTTLTYTSPTIQYQQASTTHQTEWPQHAPALAATGSEDTAATARSAIATTTHTTFQRLYVARSYADSRADKTATTCTAPTPTTNQVASGPSIHPHTRTRTSYKAPSPEPAASNHFARHAKSGSASTQRLTLPSTCPTWYRPCTLLARSS